MEANPAPSSHCPGYLPAASREPLYLEERVPGCDGEVSRGTGERKLKEMYVSYLVYYFHVELKKHCSLS